MTQLIHVMRLTTSLQNHVERPIPLDRLLKTVTGEKGAEDNNIVDEWEEKDVLLRSWISGTLIEENMYLIVGCLTAKDM